MPVEKASKIIRIRAFYQADNKQFPFVPVEIHFKTYLLGLIRLPSNVKGNAIS